MLKAGDDLKLHKEQEGEHIHDCVEFATPVNTAEALPTTTGAYYLTEDVTLENPWTISSGTIDLCLHGHSIKGPGTDSVIKVSSGATLNLYDCDETEHKYSINSETGLATLSESGDKSFKGGYITGGNADNGGGVYVNTGGSFNLYGGNIVGNTATNGGGGVYVSNESGSSSKGRFNLYGGNIVGNTAFSGGGVCNYGTFTMEGGSITDNTASFSGGVYNTGTFTMQGGEITGNKAYYGGGVFNDGGTCTMTGGSITGNTAGSNGNGGGVYVNSGGTFKLSGAPVITGNTQGTEENATKNNVCLYDGKKITVTGALTNTIPIGVTMLDGGGNPTTGVFTSGWAEKMSTADPSSFFKSDSDYAVVKVPDGETGAGELKLGDYDAQVTSGDTTEYYQTLAAATAYGKWTDGSTLKLLRNVKTDQTIKVDSGATKTLDLNGFGIRYTGGTQASVITVGDGSTSGSLTLEDNATTKPIHEITLNSGRATAVNTVDATGTDTDDKKYVIGGYITGGNATDGGGVYNYGTFTMTGGNIVGNTAGNGGGVYNKGTFTMSGGSIIGNTAGYGGGVLNFSTFTMSGGSITGNTATGNGGGVDVNLGTFTMKGGEITDNTVPEGKNGGGVYVDSFDITFNLSGQPTIKGNTVGGTTDNNVYLPTGKKITVSDALTNGTSIGVTMESGTGTFTSGWKGMMPTTTTTPANFFSSDENKEVSLDSNGEVQLTNASGASGDNPGGSTPSGGTPSGGGTVTPTPATITIPVSGEGDNAVAVNVTVQVSGSTATVTSADVDKVLEAKDVGNVTVDVSGLSSSVDEVVLPAELVEKVAKAVANQNNDASGLEIKLPTGTVTFDAMTVATLAQQSNGKNLKVHLNKVSETALNNAQQSTVKALNTLVVLDAYVTADGKRISDFNGGTANFCVPVTLADGQVAAGVTAFFVAENGEKTEIPCTYDGKNATGTVTHFSNYVVAYDVAKAQKAEEDAKAVEDAAKVLDTLPAASDVKLEDKEAIEKARAAYDALTDEQKAKVPADTLKKLTDAEAALNAAEPEPTPEPGKVSYDDLSEAEKKQAEEIAAALGVDKDTAAAMVKTAQELGVSLDTVKLSGAALKKMDVDSGDAKGSAFGKLTARATKRTNTAITLQWKKVKEADGYLIYGNRCGKKYKMKLVKTIKKNKTVKLNFKGLKKGKYYKYMVVAYKNVNGQKMPIAASVTVHAATKGMKYTIAKSVKVNKTKVTLKKGKTFQLKASEVKDETKKTIKQHRKIKNLSQIWK